MIRLDMSEYMERHTVSKLIGSPPGYSASTKVASSPKRSAVAPTPLCSFDEIEKPTPMCSICCCSCLRWSSDRFQAGRFDFKKHLDHHTSNIAFEGDREGGGGSASSSSGAAAEETSSYNRISFVVNERS